MQFSRGFVESTDKATNSYYVRAVRGGPCRSAKDWCIDDSDCDDGVYCNGTETCAASACQDGTAPCEAGETCNETAGTCDAAPECTTDTDCPDNDIYCDGTPVCTDGTCGPGTAIVCVDDDNACNGVETCNEGTESC